MKVISGLLFYKGGNVERQNVLWNIAGSFCYAFASMVLAFLVMRMAGDEKGGIFSFGFSTLGQQMFIVAYFGIRPFHVTDGTGEYSFQDYLIHRYLTCFLALGLGFLFLAAKTGLHQYSAEKSAVLFLLVAYKVMDGFADVYESEFQRQGSLYLTGKSLCFRTVLASGCFLAVLAAAGNLLAACGMAAAAQILGIFLFNVCPGRLLGGIDRQGGQGQIARLFQSTGLLFLSVFLDFYIFSAAKYSIDARMTDDASGYFNLIFMPTSVIYLVANFVIRPYLTRLTALWTEARFEEFKKQLFRIGAIIGGLTVLAVAGAALLGPWVLGIMERILGAGYEGSLEPYAPAFVLIVLGGGLYALANLMYYALVIMRKQKMIFYVYLRTAIGAALISGPMVALWGILGAACCYLLLMGVLAVSFGAGTWNTYMKEKGKHGGNRT